MRGRCARNILAVMILVALVGVAALAEAAAIRQQISGFAPSVLAPNDDGSTSAVPIGFTINFFGVNFSTLFVNNNGNVTFGQRLSTFTPFPLNATTTVPIIAPFFADVDTRGTPPPGVSPAQLVVYGNGFVSGRLAFIVAWINVGYFNSAVDKLNSFQLVLIDRSDTGAGNFDFEFNYDQIRWETGSASGGVAGLGGSSARVGFANGTTAAGTFLELGDTDVNSQPRDGQFLDGGPNSLVVNQRGSDVLGRYVFQARNGALAVTDTLNVIGAVGTGNGPSQSPVVDGAGRFTAYQSSAPDAAQQVCLAGPNDPVGTQIYRHDFTTFTRLCVSRVNPPGNGDSTNASISDAGDRIAFQSNSTNLGCTGGNLNILLATIIGQSVSLSCLTNGVGGSNTSPAISPDGLKVAFATTADLGATVPGCGGSQSKIVVQTVATGARTCATPSANGPSFEPALNGDGSKVVFRSRATNLVSGALPPAGCTTATDNILVRDLTAGTTTCVSRTPTNTQANGPSVQPDISNDGSVIVYASLATNAPAATAIDLLCISPGIQQVFSFISGVNKCLTRAPNGDPGNGSSSEPAMSGNGSFVAFTTDATNIIPASPVVSGPSAARSVVAQTGVPTQIIMMSTNVLNAVAQMMSDGPSGMGNGNSRSPALNFAGNRAVFQTAATNLFSGDTNNAEDVVGSNEPRPLSGRVEILQPSNGSIFPLTAQTALTVQWSDIGASSYGVEFSCPNTQFTNVNGNAADPVNGFGSSCGGGGFPVIGRSSFSTTLLPGTFPLGTYNLRVIPLGVPGATFSNSIAITLGPVSAIGNPTPLFTTPTPGSVTQVSVGVPISFAWTPVVGAPFYQFNFNGPLSGSFVVNTSSFGTTVPSIPPGAYSITITALNAANQPLGPASTPVTVNVQ